MGIEDLTPITGKLTITIFCQNDSYNSIFFRFSPSLAKIGLHTENWLPGWWKCQKSLSGWLVEGEFSVWL